MTPAFDTSTPQAAVAIMCHVLELAEPFSKQLRNRPHVLFDRIHDHVLDWFVGPPVDFLGDDLGPRDGELVALATQRFDQDCQVQLTATGHQEFIRAFAVLYTQADIGL